MTEKEKSYAEMLYQPGDPELVADREITVRKLTEYNGIDPLDREARDRAIRGILGKAGKNCVVEQPLFCTYGYNTTVGDNFFLNVNGKLMDSGKITIGNNVFIAPNVCIITEEHAMDVEQRIQGLEYTHPVTIGDNVWICAGALSGSGKPLQSHPEAEIKREERVSFAEEKGGRKWPKKGNHPQAVFPCVPAGSGGCFPDRGDHDADLFAGSRHV